MDQYKDMAMSEMKRSGIPASIKWHKELWNPNLVEVNWQKCQQSFWNKMQSQLGWGDLFTCR